MRPGPRPIPGLREARSLAGLEKPGALERVPRAAVQTTHCFFTACVKPIQPGRVGRLAHPAAAGDAFDLGLDLGLDDVGEVIIQPLLQERTQKFPDHVFKRAEVLGHQERR